MATPVLVPYWWLCALGQRAELQKGAREAEAVWIPMSPQVRKWQYVFARALLHYIELT